MKKLKSVFKHGVYFVGDLLHMCLNANTINMGKGVLMNKGAGILLKIFLYSYVEIKYIYLINNFLTINNIWKILYLKTFNNK